jgi:hypothetical protein
MGWFLTRKKGSKGKATKARGSSASPRPWDPQRTLLGLKVLLAVTLASSAIAGWYFGERALAEYVTATQSDPVGVDDVILRDPPAWMSPEVQMRVRTVVAEQVSMDPLDGEGLRKATRELSKEPWVAGVERVRRRAGGKVEVTADYRQPMAIVRALDGYHLVDSEGYRLPGLYYRDQVSRLGLPVLVGVAAAPPGEAGRLWQGQDLQAGLRLIQTLAGEPYFSQIQSFDVSARDNRDRIRLALHTTRGTVFWGLPPGEERTVETSSGTKIARLRELNQRFGTIDAGGKIVHIYGASTQTSDPVMFNQNNVPVFTAIGEAW